MTYWLTSSLSANLALSWDIFHPVEFLAKPSLIVELYRHNPGIVSGALIQIFSFGERTGRSVRKVWSESVEIIVVCKRTLSCWNLSLDCRERKGNKTGCKIPSTYRCSINVSWTTTWSILLSNEMAPHTITSCWSVIGVWSEYLTSTGCIQTHCVWPSGHSTTESNFNPVSWISWWISYYPALLQTRLSVCTDKSNQHNGCRELIITTDVVSNSDHCVD